MRPSLRLLPYVLPGLLYAGLSTHAQEPQTATDELQPEHNVRIEYAEVLRVEPVQPSAADEHTGDCIPATGAAPAQAARKPQRPQDAHTSSSLTLSLHAGRARDNRPPTAATPAHTDTAATQCPPEQPLPLYDVDYVLRGIKYRSRLPYDPGNRLQVQLSVTPVLAPEHPKLEPPGS